MKIAERFLVAAIISGAIYKWIWDTYIAIRGTDIGVMLYLILVYMVYKALEMIEK